MSKDTRNVHLVVASTSGVQHFALRELDVTGVTYDDAGYPVYDAAQNVTDAVMYDMLWQANGTALYGNTVPVNADDPAFEAMLAVGCVLSGVGVITAELLPTFFAVPEGNAEMADTLSYYHDEAVELAAKFADCTIEPDDNGIICTSDGAELGVVSVVTGF